MTLEHDRERALVAAIAHLRAGRLLDAERELRATCAADPNHARAFHLAGVVAHQLRRSDAVILLDRAVSIDPRSAEAQNDRGAVLAAGGLFRQALDSFEQAVKLRPDYLEARNNLARALLALGRPAKAVAELERAVTASPNAPPAHLQLAAALEAMGELLRAEQHYRTAIALRPDFLDAHLRLAGLLQTMARLTEALEAAERAVAIAPRSAGARNNLGNVLRGLARRDEAIAQYQEALRIDPSLSIAHYNLGVALRGETRIAEARAHFAEAGALKPDFLEAALAHCIAELPALYATAAEIDERRAAYAAGLAAFVAKLERTRETGSLVEAIGAHQPFYLPYQGRNDRELQSLYGAAICNATAARYQPAAPAPPPASDEPIRLAIASGFFRQHSNWKIPIKGWLTRLDRDRFRVSGYHTGPERDRETDAAATLCDRFVEGPRPLDAWRRAILDDAPHVLLFPEIGMDKVAAQLATMRLAAVQCASWGHPITSGFPTIDYFLSSDLMEPKDAELHYSEKLVRLPNLSIYYEPGEGAAAKAERTELGLRADAVLYWCAQSLPKYLPQFDDVFAAIARNVPNSQFIFIEFPGGRAITEAFKARLDRAFQAAGLAASDRCIFLPRLAPERFAAAMGASDIVLDSIGWSGCNSILESLVHDLPIVAFEGELMRGRHAAAILNMMQLDGTTARSVEEYVAIASRLGCDAVARREISSRIAVNKRRVYRDGECIAGLEAFLDRAVRGI